MPEADPPPPSGAPAADRLDPASISLERMFDVGFYRAAHDLPPGAGLAHFLSQGDGAGLDPSPYFSTRFYKAHYPDWAERGAGTAFEDFLARAVAGEARQPHPLIDPVWYLAAYPDLSGLGGMAALHFLILGDRELRSPSAGFDAGFYRRCYLPLGQRQPFRHFVTEGQKTGCLPRPHPRSPAASRREGQRIAAGLDRPVLLALHDAQAAGVPILTRDLAREMIAQGRQPVFLLQRAGPLLADFRALGPVTILAEGWDLPGLVAGLPPDLPALVNTGVAAELAAELAGAGHPCMVLINEMSDFLRAGGHIAPLRAARDAGATLLVLHAGMVPGYIPDLGVLEDFSPGMVLPPTPMAAFRGLRTDMRAAGGPVFIGAGHADRRKGFDLFLAAAAAIAARSPAARFVWLGELDDWARGLAEVALADGLDLTLPGFTPHSLAWYRAADVYLLTSRQDPGPTTMAHAAAVGTPTVGYAADIGLIDRAAPIARFIAPGDTEGFATAALAAAAAVTPALRRRLRRFIRAETAFAPPVTEMLARLDRGRSVSDRADHG